MMEGPGKAIAKLNLVMDMLNGVAWIQEKMHTSYNPNAIADVALGLLASQLQKEETS
jgi:hypothetical protein